jgi:hypothetical protein
MTNLAALLSSVIHSILLVALISAWFVISRAFLTASEINLSLCTADSDFLISCDKIVMQNGRLRTLMILYRPLQTK